MCFGWIVIATFISLSLTGLQVSNCMIFLINNVIKLIHINIGDSR